MTKTEQNKGKLRLPTPRLSDAGQGATPEQVEKRREQLRENARCRVSKEAAKAGLKAVAGRKVRRALKGAATPAESALVAENALALAADAMREVGVFASPFVAHHTTRFGVNAALAGFFTQKAAEAGFDSERGLELLEAAHSCEGQATRAMVACEAAVKAFGAAKRPKARTPIDAIEARATELLAGQRETQP